MTNDLVNSLGFFMTNDLSTPMKLFTTADLKYGMVAYDGWVSGNTIAKDNKKKDRKKKEIRQEISRRMNLFHIIL